MWHTSTTLSSVWIQSFNRLTELSTSVRGPSALTCAITEARPGYEGLTEETATGLRGWGRVSEEAYLGKACERQNSLVVESTGPGLDCLGSNPSTTGSPTLIQLFNLSLPHFSHCNTGKRYSWPWNGTGPLTCGLFSINTVLYSMLVLASRGIDQHESREIQCWSMKQESEPPVRC